ncbi:MAG: molybdopterin converting factor subunit 1 [bacterium]|nr:molybdopterin converting factor subunit 1 [bacterium]
MADLNLVYFAWVREAIGVDGERIDRPAPGATIGDVVATLAARGGGYTQGLGDPSKLRAALDQRFASFDEPVADARELALFPPVTGG